MQFEFTNNNYDLLHGAMGYGFYFLKRYVSPLTSDANKRTYQGFLESLLNSLETMAIKDGEGLKWESVINHEEGTKGFNLSLSHGMSSIIYLLSKMHFNGIAKDRIAILIEGASNYIQSFETKEKKGRSLYPSWIEPNQVIEYQGRLAWCYGDIGVGKAMEWAGKVLEDELLINKAQNILLDTSKRKSSKETVVIDAGYCHGSFGNAHIFHQLWRRNKRKDFYEAAKFWMEDGFLKHSKDNEQPFLQWNGVKKSWRFESNLLEGISGIGLAMIDYLSENENTWDECLMLR